MKLFSSIFEGSLYGKFEPTVTFIAMLALADREGTVDMTPKAIAARCGFPIELVEKGIKELEKPDPLSRTMTHEGRRIVLVNAERSWGWQIVNYIKYRDIRTAEERREYMRQYKRKQRSTMSTTVHPSEAESEADTEAEARVSLNSDSHNSVDTSERTKKIKNLTGGLANKMGMPR